MDTYGHVNNVKFYSFFDTAVNRCLLEKRLLALPPPPSSPIGFVVASSCTFLSPLRFPAAVTVGLRVARVGGSSATYHLGVFHALGACAAFGEFTHVYVDSATQRPRTISKEWRAELERLR